MRSIPLLPKCIFQYADKNDFLKITTSAQTLTRNDDLLRRFCWNAVDTEYLTYSARLTVVLEIAEFVCLTV